MKYIVFMIALMTFLVSCQSKIDQGRYRVAYKNDRDGRALAGSKAQLIQAIRGGADIRIGWGFKGKVHTIEHLSDPIWIAVLDEKEVIAHLDPQVLSSVDWDSLTASYADSSLLQQEWRVVLSTNGEFDAVWYDRKKEKMAERRPQNHTMTWYVKGDISKAGALFLN